MIRRPDTVALSGILAFALALRLWGIGYGLPWLFYFHDEPQVVLRALRFGTGDLNPHFFIWPATLLLWLAFASYGVLFLVGKILGWWSGAQAFAAAYFRDPTVFYVLPRLHSVAFGTWTVWLAHRLGRDGYSASVGLAAALGLAIQAVHAHYSHLVHPVTAMTAFTVLGLWAAVRVAHGGAFRHLFLGSLAIALGTAAQYHAGLVAVPLGVAVGYRALDATGSDRRRWWLGGAAAGALAVVGFLALSPFVVLDFATFRSDLAWITAKSSGALWGRHRGSVEGSIAFVRLCLVPALHLPLAATSLAGFALALWRRTRTDVLLIAFVAAYLALASRSAVLIDRYALPLVVPALLLSARALESALAALRHGARAGWAVPLGIGLLVAPSALELVETDWTMTRSDTRVESLRWFETHVPENERVVIDMLKFWNSQSPPLAENKLRTEERIAEIERGVSGAGHGRAYLEYYRQRLEHLHHPAYYLSTTDMGEAAKSLADYRRQGFRWAVVSQEAWDGNIASPAPPDSSGAAYYRAVSREATLAAEFRPRPWVRRGPWIRIYRLDQAAAGP